MTDRNSPLLVIIIVLLLAAIGGGAWLWLSTDAAPPVTSTTDNSTTNAPNINVYSTTTTSGDTSTSGVSGETIASIRARVAGALGVSGSAVTIVSVNPKTWSDGCFGLGGPAESCIQMLTPGYEVTTRVNGKLYVYRTDALGTSVRLQS